MFATAETKKYDKPFQHIKSVNKKYYMYVHVYVLLF